ncbi:MAG: carboxymuconolactone decarboxylase family protein [Steroidobacteraceae bacterium]
MSMTPQQLRAALTRAMGGDEAAWQTLVATDPQVVAEYIKLADATTHRQAIEPRYRELIQIAIAASTAHLFVPGIQLHMARALQLGATKDEILDTLRLASVIGIHCLIPAVGFLVDALGGTDAVNNNSTEAERARAEQIKTDFKRARGFWPDAWNNSALLAPEFLSAYVDYSALPQQAAHLPDKVREFIYLAVDISPTHFHEVGARAHMSRALQKGATRDEVMEVIEIASLIGFNTCLVALPLLAQLTEDKNN